MRRLAPLGPAAGLRVGLGAAAIAATPVSVPAGGTLELAVNDLTLADGDNAGGFTVQFE